MGDSCSAVLGTFRANGLLWVWTCQGEMLWSAAVNWFWPAWHENPIREGVGLDAGSVADEMSSIALMVNAAVVVVGVVLAWRVRGSRARRPQ